MSLLKPSSIDDHPSAISRQPSALGLERWLFWASVWLAFALVAIKGFHLGLAGTPAREVGQLYLRALAAISYADVVFVVLFWSVARAMLALCARRRTARLVVVVAFTACATLLCLYAVLNVVMFPLFGGFLTYPLLALVGDVRMLRSSVTTYLRPGFIAGLVCLPLAYVALVWISARGGRHGHSEAGRRHSGSPAVHPQPDPTHEFPSTDRTRFARRRQLLSRAGSGSYVRAATAGAVALAWIAVGADAYSSRWTTRADRAIAENPEWVFVSSWWRAVRSGGGVEMSDRFDPADLADFEPLGARARPLAPTHAAAGPPLNVILIVLESVGARWTSLNSRVYDNTTPSLVAESAHGLVFDNFYAHIGRSSNSLAAILLSIYPKLDFRDITDEYPRLAGTSLATTFERRGYRTAFITPSDMSWAGWSTFLEGRGFGEIRDDHQLACTEPLSSWGVEDRCMFEGILSYIAQEPRRPFFIMGWTQQTHHPYEPTPGVPLLDLVREPVADEYDLNRYLNVLHETDAHLGRMLEGIRRAGLDQRTLVVVVGDHGQAFGFPHAGSYMQGRTIYQEDGNVPLMLWYPRLYKSAMRSKTIGGHVDLAPTIAELAGLAPAADWQGRSLLDPGHPPRAYFYVAEDRFRLGVREDRWKYIYDLREGIEELYDLQHDPDEQHNLAAAEPVRSARLRQRLAAWTEANRRHYQQQ
ncbi:MAG: sulfatase-like hydrolase/transferase [Acidobacteriota bacterium]